MHDVNKVNEQILKIKCNQQCCHINHHNAYFTFVRWRLRC